MRPKQALVVTILLFRQQGGLLSDVFNNFEYLTFNRSPPCGRSRHTDWRTRYSTFGFVQGQRGQHHHPSCDGDEISGFTSVFSLLYSHWPWRSPCVYLRVLRGRGFSDGRTRCLNVAGRMNRRNMAWSPWPVRGCFPATHLYPATFAQCVL